MQTTTREKKITRKEIIFVEAYIKSHNACQAALEAGYSEKNAQRNSYKFLLVPRIQEYYNSRIEEIKTENTITQQEILERLTRIARGEEEDDVFFSPVDKVQKKVDTRYRLEALKTLAKIYKLEENAIDTDNTIQVNITPAIEKNEKN